VSREPQQPSPDSLFGRFGVQGSGGCAAAGDGPVDPGWFLLALAALLGRRRVRPAFAALVAAAVLAAPSARAAGGTDVAIEVQRFQPSGGGRDILGVGSALTPGHLRWGLNVFGNFASSPLQLVDKSGKTAPVDLLGSQTGVDLAGTIGLLDRYELSLVLPLTAYQDSGHRPAGLDSFDAGLTAGGFSSLRIVPKARVRSFGDLHLAVAVPVVLPLGSGAPYLDPGGPSVHPRAIVEWSRDFRVAANVGVAVRGDRDLADLAVGPALTFGAGGEVPFQLAGQELVALATLVGETGFREQGEAETPLELLVGGRWRGPAGTSFTLAAGPGLTSGYGTPEYRVVAGVGLLPPAAPAPLPRPVPPVPLLTEAPKPEPKPAPAPVPPPEPPSDRDGDGLADASDHCPDVAEDLDGDADDDGCPEEAKVVVEAERIAILEAVHFAVAKDVILATSHDVLEQVAKVLREHPTVRVRIEGHTDTTGGADFNRKLSARRAKSVRRFLVEQGVAEDRLLAEGYGPDRPVDTNATPEGRQKNRRVDFVILEP
jgi:uncharacterized protein (TIGR03382 family)